MAADPQTLLEMANAAASDPQLSLLIQAGKLDEAVALHQRKQLPSGPELVGAGYGVGAPPQAAPPPQLATGTHDTPPAAPLATGTHDTEGAPAIPDKFVRTTPPPAGAKDMTHTPESTEAEQERIAKGKPRPPIMRSVPDPKPEASSKARPLPPAGPSTVKLTTKQSVYHTPEMSKQAAKDIGAANKKLADEETAKLARDKQINDRKAEINKRFEDMSDAALKDYGAKGKAFWNEYENAKEATAASLESLKNFKMDPDRMWAQMGSTNAAVAMIGEAAYSVGNFFMGKGNASNKVTSIIEKAIDRDMLAQKAEFEKLLRVHGANERATNAAMAAWSTTEQLKRNEMKTLAALSLVPLTLQKENSDASLAAAKAIRNLSVDTAKAQNATRAKGTTTTVTREVPVKRTGAGAGTKQLSDKTKAEVRNLANLSARVGELGTKLESFGGNPATRKLKTLPWWTQERYAKAMRGYIAMLQTRAASGAQAGQKEIQYSVDLIPGPDDTVEVARQKLRSLQRMVELDRRGYRQQYPSDVYDPRGLAPLDSIGNRATTAPKNAKPVKR